MGNNHGKILAGNSVESSTIDVEHREKSSGVGDEKNDSDMSMMEAGEVSSNNNSQGYDKARTKEENKKGERASSNVLIENKTKKTLKLREKKRGVNGQVRYTIEAGKSLEIKDKPEFTYYRLLVYAIEIDSSNIEDTNLTIDTDMLRDATHIVLCKDEAGKYVLNCS